MKSFSPNICTVELFKAKPFWTSYRFSIFYLTISSVSLNITSGHWTRRR